MENYSRFYAIFNRLPYSGDREEFKKSVVLQYTWNRTEHLHEMTEREYDECCRGMEKMIPGNALGKTRGECTGGDSLMNSKLYFERKKRRSAALHQLQLYGVDTTNWGKVNAFCKDSRIAGKVFSELDCEELEALTKKMRAIIRKRDKQQ
ncbi:MAG: hypothetical protein II826_03085 [Prevotella sp.]|nr:hypothetical protein [Prevotella sp.]